MLKASRSASLCDFQHLVQAYAPHARRAEVDVIFAHNYKWISRMTQLGDICEVANGGVGEAHDRATVILRRPGSVVEHLVHAAIGLGGERTLTCQCPGDATLVGFKRRIKAMTGPHKESMDIIVGDDRRWTSHTTSFDEEVQLAVGTDGPAVRCTVLVRCLDCNGCGQAMAKRHVCARCRSVSYCGPACQLAHWAAHRRTCRR